MKRITALTILAISAPLFLSVAVVSLACPGIVSIEYSTVEAPGGVLLVCPTGDGPELADIGGTISIRVLGAPCPPSFPEPIPMSDIPATDIWIWSEDLGLCGGSASSNADAATDLDGRARISGAVASGGQAYANAQVVVMGMTIGVIPGLTLVSPDMNGDLEVDLIDLGDLATAFGGVYDPRADLNADGMVTLSDIGLFAQHWLHGCDN